MHNSSRITHHASHIAPRRTTPQRATLHRHLRVPEYICLSIIRAGATGAAAATAPTAEDPARSHFSSWIISTVIFVLEIRGFRFRTKMLKIVFKTSRYHMLI